MAAKKTQSKSRSVTLARTSKVRAFLSVDSARLLGKVAVVTGASRGIGFAIARLLASEGCTVVITGRDQRALNASALRMEALSKAPRLPGKRPPQILPRACDVRDPEAVGSLFQELKQRFNKIDILVNNAGIAQPNVPVERTSFDTWREVVDTNLTGTFLCTRAALPLMTRGATVINNLSIAAKTAFPNFAAYNAAKQGALGFTMTLRLELMSRGIRVVALMVGATDTDIWLQFWPEAPRERMMEIESAAQAVLYAVLLPPNANLSELVLAPTGGSL